MEIHQLEQFIAIAECANMTEAAERLFVSQPALSKNLKKLEAELGVPLFDRTHNQLELTPYGQILLEHARRAFLELKEALGQIDQEKVKEATVVRIGSFYLPLNLLFFPWLANLFPEKRFEIVVRKPDALMKDLVDGQIDLAFLPDTVSSAHFKVEPILQEGLLLSVSPNSPLAHNSVISSDDLKSLTIIVPKNLPGLSDWYEEVLRGSHAPDVEPLRLPIKSYLHSLDIEDQVHFITSTVAKLTASEGSRPMIPLTGELATRRIVLAYLKTNTRVQDIAEGIIAKKDELFDSRALLAFLMYQSEFSNLSMNIDY